ncbi:hypothetical protein Q4577_23620, partial [Marinovum sp. 2_MG-2023]|uniref:hypothetical protein n=1 Tax=Marinovum sp. 2_MG-2023 TaxID=3062637 RepID=UPI0026E2BC6D
MMGPRQAAQPSLFYEFSLEDHVPQDHLLRSIDRDLPPAGPSFIMRVCRLNLGIRLPRLTQARRARSL